MIKKNLKILLAVFSISLFIYIVFIVKVSNLDLLLDPRKATPLSPLYYLKVGREYFQSKFFFGEEDALYRKLDLAEKRISEAEILKSRGFVSLANSRINEAKKLLDNVQNKIQSLSEQTNVNYLKDKYTQIQDRIDKL